MKLIDVHDLYGSLSLEEPFDSISIDEIELIPTIEAIPISFIRARIKRLDADIDFELYESDGMDWRPIIKKESLLELIREWEKYEAR